MLSHGTKLVEPRSDVSATPTSKSRRHTTTIGLRRSIGTYSDQGQAPPLLMPGVKLNQFYNDLGQLSRLAEDRGIFDG